MQDSTCQIFFMRERGIEGTHHRVACLRDFQKVRRRRHGPKQANLAAAPRDNDNQPHIKNF